MPYKTEKLLIRPLLVLLKTANTKTMNVPIIIISKGYLLTLTVL